MSSIKNVAIVGAAGDLGGPILKAVVDSGKFNVTVITRPSSTSIFPSSLKVIKADYTSVDSLTSALHGQDAVVSASAEPKLYNSGDFKFSATALASVGQAVVGVLSHPEETKNRPVYVQDMAISQSKMLELARKVAPEKKWNPITMNLDEEEKWANEKFAQGDLSLPVMYAYLSLVMFRDGYGSRMEKVDNELLGIKGTTEADVEAIFEKLLA
ncbi:hypothetical protein ACEPPN_001277 [Leptodophora sp. 'Broadleaf-Isolate-01']